MSTALDWIGGHEPDHLEQFTRLRAYRESDPYNPDSTVENWARVDEITVRGAWASSSSSLGFDAVRSQLTTSKQITIFDPAADVLVGDRIRSADGHTFKITGRPESDINPWTGWRPTLVVSVEEVTG